jgi:hypothetical protein
MPLQKNEDFGTNADGSKNKEYCHFCFQNGHFIDSNITMEQQIGKLVGIAVSQQNMPEGQARKMANEIIPTLKRWRKK